MEREKYLPLSSEDEIHKKIKNKVYDFFFLSYQKTLSMKYTYMALLLCVVGIAKPASWPSGVPTSSNW